jgi:hypothetical protein
LGRRGPGAGLRQAQTAFEAAQWRRLFDALASPEAMHVLPHLGLRSGDAPRLRDVATEVRTSLDTILAGTHGADLLDRANDVLAGAYADLEHQHCARLARGVFALSSDGFPGPDEAAVMAAWDRSLRALARGDGLHAAVPAAKRDIVVALIGHHLAAIEPLDTLAAEHAAGGRTTTADLDWLVDLARWRRYAIVRRALAKVLTPSERQRLVGSAAPPDPWQAGRRDVVRAAG